MRLSLSNRLALVFFAITLLAVGALYLYVAPGLQSRLTGEKLTRRVNVVRPRHNLGFDGGRFYLGAAPVAGRINGSTLTSLGVTSTKRTAVAPEIPAIAETLPGMDMISWTTLTGPAKLPPNTPVFRDLNAVGFSQELRPGR